MRRPRVFVGSARESLPIAEAIQGGLRYDAEVVVWNQLPWPPTGSTLATLVSHLPKFDFAIMVFTADDLVDSRGATARVPRDNVVLEFGMCVGAIGSDRTFFLVDRSGKAKLPSDLAGITPLEFEHPSSPDLRTAAVGDACRVVRDQIAKNGLRQDLPALGTVRYADRSSVSQTFALGSLKTLDIFAGDVSWLVKDLAAYESLRVDRKVAVRILCDAPEHEAVAKCKTLGIELRKYSGGAAAPLKASIADAEDLQASLIVFEKVRPTAGGPPAAGATPYDYRVKRYVAPEDRHVIRAASLLFDGLFTRGIEIP